MSNSYFLTKSFIINATQKDAFHAFIDKLAAWWPKEYTWSNNVLETIAIEPKEGGRCFERGPYGFECDWGRVLTYKPDSTLIFTWQIGPDRVPEPNPEKSSEVEVSFLENNSAKTEVQLQHRLFHRHGNGAEDYCFKTLFYSFSFYNKQF